MNQVPKNWVFGNTTFVFSSYVSYPYKMIFSKKNEENHFSNILYIFIAKYSYGVSRNPKPEF